MMSSVGLSVRGKPIGGVGGIGGGAAATTRRSYHCYECNSTVAILDNDELVCPLCYGAFLEELDRTNSSPSSPLTTAVSSVTLCDYFPSSAFDYDSDNGDSCLLPPPPPPPLPPFTTADDAFFHDRHNDITESSEYLPPPSPSTLRTIGTISGLTIDFSETLTLDNYCTYLPPPPPLPLSPPRSTSNSNDASTSTRRTQRFPTPPPRSAHVLPLPPPRPSPATTMASIPSSSSREIQLPAYPLPPPPPLPPHYSGDWEYFLPPFGGRDYGSDVDGEDTDDLDPDRFGLEGKVMEVLEEDKSIFDRKMTKELMRSESEESSQCSVCLENLELNQIVKRMPCKHIFHSNCIVTWLDSHPTCPVCRYKLP